MPPDILEQTPPTFGHASPIMDDGFIQRFYESLSPYGPIKGIPDDGADAKAPFQGNPTTGVWTSGPPGGSERTRAKTACDVLADPFAHTIYTVPPKNANTPTYIGRPVLGSDPIGHRVPGTR